jgi:hypothetical protein
MLTGVPFVCVWRGPRAESVHVVMALPSEAPNEVSEDLNEVLSRYGSEVTFGYLVRLDGRLVKRPLAGHPVWRGKPNIRGTSGHLSRQTCGIA